MSRAYSSPRATAAIAELRARILFLPRYSPELNPIEMAFSKLKLIGGFVSGRHMQASVDGGWLCRMEMPSRGRCACRMAGAASIPTAGR